MTTRMRVNTRVDGGESDRGKTTSVGNGAGGARRVPREAKAVFLLGF